MRLVVEMKNESLEIKHGSMEISQSENRAYTNAFFKVRTFKQILNIRKIIFIGVLYLPNRFMDVQYDI